MPFINPTVRCDVDGATATLVEPLRYIGATDDFTVPAGFVTDFASVPQVVTWLVPKMGAYTRAAVLHDWLCSDLEDTAASTGAMPLASARDTDGIFRRVMRENGVNLVRRWLMWTAVRWGALATPARRAGWWRDAPAVLAITVLAAPVVVPAAVLVGLALLIDRAVELGAPTPTPLETS